MGIMNLFKEKTYKKITGKELEEKLKSAVPPILIDVRTPEEYKSGHIPKSRNIPVQNFEAEMLKSDINNDTPIVVYCQSGMRASKACSILSDLDFKEIYNLGGIGNYSGQLETVNSEW